MRLVVHGVRIRDDAEQLQTTAIRFAGDRVFRARLARGITGVARTKAIAFSGDEVAEAVIAVVIEAVSDRVGLGAVAEIPQHPYRSADVGEGAENFVPIDDGVAATGHGEGALGVAGTPIADDATP